MRDPNLTFMASFVNGISLLPLIPTPYGKFIDYFRVTNFNFTFINIFFNIHGRILNLIEFI